jgi:hypothetical protein
MSTPLETKPPVYPEPPRREICGEIVMRRDRKAMTLEEAERILAADTEPEDDPDC